MKTIRPYFSVLLVLTLVLGAGCTSLFQTSEPDVDPAEVAGTYDIHHFEFVPLSSALEPINLLEYIQDEGSSLKLTESQDFVLTYETENGEEVTLVGPFDLSPDTVTLKGQDKDEARFQRILLDRTLSLNRESSNTLSFEHQTEISPEALSSWYEGMNQGDGTLRLEFVQENEKSLK